MRIPRHVLLAGCGVALLAAPPLAAANTTVSLVGGTLTIVGTDDDDDISLGAAGSNSLGPTTRVSGRDMVAGAGCQGFGDPEGPANTGSVFCPTDDILRIQVDLGAGDDEFDNSLDLDGTIDGGAGDDEIDGGRGAVTITGGDDDDEITLGGSDGPNVVDGGPGDDVILIGGSTAADDVRGGSGLDTVSYAGHPGGVTVTLDDLADDGRPGEGDNIRADVESVIGSNLGDTLIGNDGPNTLDGAGGDDHLEGRGGNDTLIGGLGADTLLGGAGDDTLLLRDGIRDACPDGGTGVNTIDMDLVDQRDQVGRLRCLTTPRDRAIAEFRRVASQITFRAVIEGPPSRLALARPAIAGGAARVRLSCPAVLRAGCRGRLSVATGPLGRPLGQASYRVRPGRSAIVRVPLSAASERVARARRTLVLISSERGRSRLGPKTTYLVVRGPGR